MCWPTNRALAAVLAAVLLLLVAHPGAAQEKVTVGAYLHDVQSLDLKTHSFAADLYIWFRWHSPDIDPTEVLEFSNPTELWGHVRTRDYEKPLLLPSGERYQVVRVQGRFSCKLPLDDYPFDRQVLFIEFEASNLAARDMIYIADGVPITVNPSLRLPGFDIGPPRFQIGVHKYPTTFGDPRVQGHDEFSRARIELPIARPLLPHAVKMLLPVLCVMLCAAMMFLFATQYVDARVELGITSLLTVVALQITASERMPEVSYLVLLDEVYLATYVFVIAGFLLVVWTTRMVDRGHGPAAAALSRRGLVVAVLSYFSIVGMLLGRTLLLR